MKAAQKLYHFKNIIPKAKIGYRCLGSLSPSHNRQTLQIGVRKSLGWPGANWIAISAGTTHQTGRTPRLKVKEQW